MTHGGISVDGFRFRQTGSPMRTWILALCLVTGASLGSACSVPLKAKAPVERPALDVPPPPPRVVEPAPVPDTPPEPVPDLPPAPTPPRPTRPAQPRPTPNATQEPKPDAK